MGKNKRKFRYLMNIKKIVVGLGMLLVMGACDKPTTPTPKGVYSQGVFTINEGLFGNTSGTITHYDRAGKTTEKIFWKQNQRDLGDVVQSLAFQGDKGYVVVNNSNKIEVVDAHTFAELAQITNLQLPRYCLPISNTEAYVTEWGADGVTGSLARLDLVTNRVVERFSIGVGPEHLQLKNSWLYITHPGGLGDNNIVTVFDVQQKQVVTTITVGDRPSGIVEDQQGNWWVACAGKVAYLNYPTIDTANSTASQLVAIDPSTNTILQQIDFGKGNPIGNLISNQNNQLFYTRAGQVWSYELGTGVEKALFSGSFYGLGYDPNQQLIYAATSSGVNPALVQLYDLDGNWVRDYTAGVFANGFVFR